MIFLSIFDSGLPITNPVLKFLLILIIILVAPLLLNRIPKHPLEGEFREFDKWEDFLIISRDVQSNDSLIIVMSRKGKLSYSSHMTKIPEYLNSYFRENNFILVYPMQAGVTNSRGIDLTNPSLLEPVENLDEIGKTIAKLFRRK